MLFLDKESERREEARVKDKREPGIEMEEVAIAIYREAV